MEALSKLHENTYGYFAYFDSKSSNRTYKTQYWTHDYKQFTAGMITCECPAWIFKKGRERRCPHIEPMRRLLVEAGIVAGERQIVKCEPKETVNGRIKGLIDSL